MSDMKIGQIADTVLRQGQGMHGSFSRGDTYNFTAAIGPDFKAGYVLRALDQMPKQLACGLMYGHWLSVPVPDLPRTIEDSFRELESLIREQGAAFAGAPLIIYHGEVNADSDGPIEVCWPYSGILTPSGDVALRVEPAHTEAFVALTREQFEFPAILSAYDATCAYASAHGTGSPLPCREVYPYDWDNAAPGEPVGEVAWPYTPKGA